MRALIVGIPLSHVIFHSYPLLSPPCLSDRGPW